MIILPRAPYTGDTMLGALCVWREARGEPYEAKLGVAHVLRNRCAIAPREGFKPTIAENVLKPWAFSSFMASDPNCEKYPDGVSTVWQDCLRAIASDEPDPTGSAVFYFSKPIAEPPKAWGEVSPRIIIGALHFYALAAAVADGAAGHAVRR